MLNILALYIALAVLFTLIFIPFRSLERNGYKNVRKQFIQATEGILILSIVYRFFVLKSPLNATNVLLSVAVLFLPMLPLLVFSDKKRDN